MPHVITYTEEIEKHRYGLQLMNNQYIVDDVLKELK